MTWSWRPPPEIVEAAASTRFARAHGIASYRELVARSVDDPEWFWDAVVRWLPIEFETPYERVLDASRGPEWPRWFCGGRLNLAWNCVHRHAGRPGDALRFESEDGTGGAWTWPQLVAEVDRVAAGLAALGVAHGDRVGLVLPMTPHAVAAFYGVVSIGAVAVPIFSGFSAAAIAARLDDAGAVCVLTVDSFARRGRPVPVGATVREAAALCPIVRDVVNVPDGLPTGDSRPPVAVDSEHPLAIVYTSGTTGRPKGAVHVHGGFLVKIATEVRFQADARPDDVLCWVSDLGWIQGPWMIVGGHAAGATVALFDGAPDHPGPGRLWEFAARRRVTFLGVSPTLLRALRAQDPRPPAEELVASLRAFGCAGEPIDETAYRWLFDEIGRRARPIVNLSGGTEVGASFLSCDVSIPHKECSLGFPALGMAVDVVDGELVCRKPWPSMTRGVWGDPQRYLDAYWRRFPGLWTHGDWASVDDDGYWFLHGRSDDTLNVAGKRIGPAELEAAAVAHPAVAEAAAVGIPHEVKGEVPWLYCVAAEGADADGVADAVAAALGKAFRPARVVFVPALPKTRSAKIVRRAIRAAALGLDAGDLSTLENPDALDEIRRS